MRLLKMKKVMEDLEKLKDSYVDLRLLISDQVRDDEIVEAKENFAKLERLGEAIKQMENLDVQISQSVETI